MMADVIVTVVCMLAHALHMRYVKPIWTFQLRGLSLVGDHGVGALSSVVMGPKLIPSHREAVAVLSVERKPTLRPNEAVILMQMP